MKVNTIEYLPPLAAINRRNEKLASRRNRFLSNLLFWGFFILLFACLLAWRWEALVNGSWF